MKGKKEEAGKRMKDGWETKKLCEVCELLDDKRIPITKRDRLAGKYPYYGATGILDYIDGFIFDEKLVLVGEDGAKWGAGENTSFSVEGKRWVNNHAHVLRTHRNTIIDNWLIYFLNYSDLTVFVSGLTVPKLNQGNLRDIPIPLPPLPEQRRIVAILDEAFAAIATAEAVAEKNLRNARDLFESYLQAVFSQRGEGWEQKTLKQISTTFGRGKSQHRPGNAKKLYGGEYPFIQTGDIRNAEHYITKYSQTYSEAGLAQSKLWPKGTICITIAANIAETSILGFDACFPDSVIGVVADPAEADIDFVEYLLQSFKARLQLKGKGSAQANINLGTFENERFPFPAVIEQKRIVAKLTELRAETQRLEAIYTRKLAAIKELKKSLLHRAFSGELTAQSGAVSYPVEMTGMSTIDLHAGILAIEYKAHENNGKQNLFGHVKAENIAHMIEAHLGIDLGRHPIKDAAGPNDYAHLKKVESHAWKAGYYDFEPEDRGYIVRKLGGFEGLVKKTRETLGTRIADVDRLIESMLPMDSQQAEVFCTVYAAWNNLLLDGQEPTKEAIVYEARENWHPAKLDIPREQFFYAIKWMRDKDIIPAGKGKKVETKGKAK